MEEPRDTPAGLAARAGAMSSYLLGAPEAVKDGEMVRLKENSPVLHSLVKSLLKEARDAAGPAQEG